MQTPERITVGTARKATHKPDREALSLRSEPAKRITAPSGAVILSENDLPEYRTFVPNKGLWGGYIQHNHAGEL